MIIHFFSPARCLHLFLKIQKQLHAAVLHSNNNSLVRGETHSSGFYSGFYSETFSPRLLMLAYPLAPLHCCLLLGISTGPCVSTVGANPSFPSCPGPVLIPDSDFPSWGVDSRSRLGEEHDQTHQWLPPAFASDKGDPLLWSPICLISHMVQKLRDRRRVLIEGPSNP